MSRLRSSWKVPYIGSEFKALRLIVLRKYEKKYFKDRNEIDLVNQRLYTPKRNVLYTYARNSLIPKFFINKILFVFNGKTYIRYAVKRYMVGMKVGSFALTKRYGQIKSSERKKKKKSRR